MKYFGLAKRKSNISRNNHFAVIVGASIGPVSTPSHDIIYFFFHLTHSTPLFVISLPFFRRNMYVYLSCEIVGGCCYFQKKRRRKDMWTTIICVMLWGDATIIAWQILTTLRLLVLRWSFMLFQHSKKKWFFLSHALWFGLLFFLSLQWARKFFIKKKMKKPLGANLFRECLYVFVCIQYTYKGWAIILRRAIFFPVSQYSK